MRFPGLAFPLLISPPCPSRLNTAYARSQRTSLWWFVLFLPPPSSSARYADQARLLAEQHKKDHPEWKFVRAPPRKGKGKAGKAGSGPTTGAVAVGTSETDDGHITAARAKAKPKGKSAPKACPEPVWETFELALEAGSKCHKCTARLHGTKGCRACMGHWFEEIRRRAPTRGKFLDDLLE